MSKTEPTACRICGEELSGNNRLGSHILTESSYAKHQIKKSGDHLGVYKNGKRIDADIGHHIKERMLCQKCERRLGIWEAEREHLFASEIRPHKNIFDEHYVSTSNYNWEYIKLACLADIFRSYYAKDELYDEISNLDYSCISDIKTMLLTCDAKSSKDYPVTIFRYNDNSRIMDGTNSIPSLYIDLNGIKSCQAFVHRGWVWAAKVDIKPCIPLEEYALGTFGDEIRIVNLGDARNSAGTYAVRRSLPDNPSEI